MHKSKIAYPKHQLIILRKSFSQYKFCEIKCVKLKIYTFLFLINKYQILSIHDNSIITTCLVNLASKGYSNIEYCYLNKVKYNSIFIIWKIF